MKIVIAAAALVAAAGAASAAPIAYWSFPTTAPSQNYNLSYPILADFKATAGVASIDTDAPKYDGSPAPNAIQQGAMQYFAGTTVNSQFGAVAGQALSMRNDTQDRAQGKSLFVRFDGSGYSDYKLSYAERYSSTGPTGVSISYSTDGINYSAFTSYATNRSGAFGAAAQVIDLSAVNSIEGFSSVYFKITFTGFNAGSNGTARIDNVLVEGTLIPTPAAASLLALVGLAAARRRR